MSKKPPRANPNEITDRKNKDPALSVFVVFTLKGFEVEPRADPSLPFRYGEPVDKQALIQEARPDPIFSTIGSGQRLGPIESGDCTPYRSTLPMGTLECLEVKMIGKPYAGELQVRFDEGGQDFFLRTA